MLNVSENALSEKLACDIFFYLDSLKELNMENCKLETLSRRSVTSPLLVCY